MSTFTEKTIDFEISVRLPRETSVPRLRQWLTTTDNLGRERLASRATLQAGHFARADVRPRGVHLQDLGPALHHIAQPEVLPHAREPQLQHRHQHREAHRALQHDPDRPDYRHGCAAGLCRQVLFPGR